MKIFNCLRSSPPAEYGFHLIFGGGAEAYSEPCQAFNQERAAKVVNGFLLLQNASTHMFDRVLNKPQR